MRDLANEQDEILRGIERIYSGPAADHSAAIERSASRCIRTWGANGHGQLGDGTTRMRRTTMQVRDHSDPLGLLVYVTELAVGGAFTIARK